MRLFVFRGADASVGSIPSAVLSGGSLPDLTLEQLCQLLSDGSATLTQPQLVRLHKGINERVEQLMHGG